MLGTNVGSVELVKYAKSEGAYVIVADYLPVEESEAKQYADENVMISTTDIDSLCEFGGKRRIDGVFCGVSEVNLLSVRAVAERLGLPCYFTKEQWKKTENKAEFKKVCESFGIPVAKQYKVEYEDLLCPQDNLKYPVVVKPVDRSAGIGIHICYSQEELLAGYKDAYEKSFCQQVIVEEYLVGLEYTATYSVINGEYTVSAIYDRYVNHEIKDQLPVTEVHVYPSKYIKQYMEKVNSKLIEMMKSLGFTNGSFFVQGIANEKSAYIFEAGLRLAGSGTYRLIEHVNGINMLKLMTEYALTAQVTARSARDDPFFGGKVCCTLNVLCRDGIIGKVEGTEDVRKVSGVVNTVVAYQVGDVIPVAVPIKYIFMRLYIVTDTKEQMCNSINEIHKLIKVWDDKGENMKLNPLEPTCYLF